MNTGNRFAHISALFVVAIGASACGSGDMVVNVKSLSAGTATTVARVLENPLAIGIMAAGDYGAASVGTTGLSSYKLYIKELRLCEGLAVTDGSTAYNDPTGCSSIYVNDGDNYDTFGVTEAAAATTGKYFDVLSATDRASLTQNTSVSTGEYHYGLIDWYKPVKMTATVQTMNAAATLYTKACESYDSNGSCVISTMTTASAAEAIIPLNNGGTWFKFLKPFTVARGDAVELDLAFDLEKKVIAGADVSGGGSIIQETACSGLGGTMCGISVPMLKLVPVPRKAGESTIVETYEMTPAGSTQWKLRVDVYYNSADATKTVLAADAYTIPTAASTASPIGAVYVQSVTETATETTFKDYNGTASLVFSRGASGSATMTCSSTGMDGCSSVGATMSLTWGSREVRTL